MRKISLFLLSLLCLCGFVQAQLTLPELKPARVAVFKNGTYFIKREADVSVTNRQAFIPPPNEVLMGTYWITVGKNTELRSASVFADSIKTTRKVLDVEDVLINSKGKTVTIRRLMGQTIREYTGVVLDYFTGTDYVKLQLPDGKVLTMKINNTEEVVSDATTATSEIKTESARFVNRLSLAQDVPRTNVATIGLEKGMAWVPGYLFRVINDKEARLEMKATIVNDGEALKQLPVDIVVGSPSMFYGMQMDPVVGDYLDDLLDDRRDNGRIQMQLYNTNAVSQARSYSPDIEEASETTAEGEKSQDLYYFKLGIMDIEARSKTIIPVFGQNITYKDVYEITIPFKEQETYYKSSIYQEDKPLEIYHSFRFTNTGKSPLTTGSMFVLDEKENMLAQDELKYTPTGAEGVIRLSKAIDVQARNDEEVTDVQENAKRLNKVSYNKATLKGQIKLVNFQQKKIKISVTKYVNGETTNISNNGTSLKVKMNSDALNPTSKITWEVELNPGEQQTITYSYSLYVD